MKRYAAALEVLNSAAAREGEQERTRALARKAHEGRAKALHKLKRHREAVADWDAAIEKADTEAGGAARRPGDVAGAGGRAS